MHDFFRQHGVVRFAGAVYDVAFDVDFPAVVETAQAAFLVAAERERRAPVRAVLVEHAEAAGGVAKRHQVLTQQPHAYRRTVALGDLLGQARRYPVAPHQLAHRRIALYPAKQLVVFDAQHIDLRQRSPSGCPNGAGGNNIRALSK